MIPESDRLDGWKAIADHLGKSIRTVQVWADERALPIHKVGGGIVAYKSEIAEWMDRRSAPDPETEPGCALVYGAPNEFESADNARPEVVTGVERQANRSWSQARFLWAGFLVLLLGLCLAAVAVVHATHRYKRPTDWRVDGNTFTVLGEDRKELWHHTFPAEMDPTINGYVAGTGRSACVFADLDGDGRVETLFRYSTNGPATDHPRLVCFNPDGRIRWQFAPNRNVVDNHNHEWTPPYGINLFAVISSKAMSSRIVVGSNHFWSFPDQVAVLSPSGKLISEFWHRGHLRRMAIGDIDGDGQPEVLFGGVNDALEYKQATLLAFDWRSISGASSSPRGDRYFQGFVPGTEKAEIFFPKTPIGQRQEFNIISEVMIKSGRIVVWVAEDIRDSTGDYVVYEMDFQLHVISVTLSDQLKAKYREEESKGAIRSHSLTAEEDRLKREVKVIRR